MSEDKTQGMTLEAKVDEILVRLTALEAKQYDTRPIWERVLSELESMNRRMLRQDSKIDDFIEEVIEMKRTLRSSV